MTTMRKPPTIPTPLFTTLGIVNWLIMKKIRTISGNSTIPCPTAINAPENLFFAAFFIVTANKSQASGLQRAKSIGLKLKINRNP